MPRQSRLDLLLGSGLAPHVWLLGSGEALTFLMGRERVVGLKVTEGGRGSAERMRNHRSIASRVDALLGKAVIHQLSSLAGCGQSTIRAWSDPGWGCSRSASPPSCRPPEWRYPGAPPRVTR